MQVRDLQPVKDQRKRRSISSLRRKSTLLSSLCDSGKGGNVGKFLHMAMKGAVAKFYEASRAAVRVTAVNQGDISFEHDS
jgi:hypothetical protein